jgi:glycosyltransferase involved in cell wall biosynthesis
MPNSIRKNNKLLIISYYWPPAGGPGVQRWVKFTQYLLHEGFEPYILTVNEKLASYAHRDDSLLSEIPASIKVFRTKTREFYGAYLRFTGKHNIPYSGFVDEGKAGLVHKIIRFLRTHLFIPDPRRGWNRFAYKKAMELIRLEDISLVITTSPPHSAQLIGMRIKRKLPSIRWLADFRDPWTGIFYFDQLCHSSLSRKITLKMERQVLNTADQVLVVGHSMKKDFARKLLPGKDPEIISIISNGYDERDFSEEAPPIEKEFTITYTGTLASNYKIDVLLEAINEILEERKNFCMKLRFVGEVCPEYREIMNTPGLRSVIEMIPRVSHQKSIEYMRSSHVLLLVIPQAPKNEAILTGKIFEYMAAGKPILGIGPLQGDAAQVLMETHAGGMFDYDDTEKIIAFLSDKIRQYENGKVLWDDCSIDNYSRQKLTKQLIQLF